MMSERDLTEETFQEFLERKDREGKVDGVIRISGVGAKDMQVRTNGKEERGTILVDTLSRYVSPQVRMGDLTVAQLWDCVEALMVLVDVRANKDMYKAGGDYKERKREAWGMAEDVLIRAGLMEVLE